MNDDFLYDLRNDPPAEFATRLKAQLERQTVEAQRKQRAFRWAAIAAMLVSTTALAFVSPTLRQATLTMIVQFRGGESTPPLDPDTQRLIEQKDARAEQRIMPDASFDPGRPPTSSKWSAASGSAASDAAAFATRPDGSTAASPAAPSAGTTIVGGSGGRTQLRMGHMRDLNAAAHRIEAVLENGNTNLEVELTSLAVSPGTCVRGGDAVNLDVWIDDRSVPSASGPCVNGRRFIEVPLAFDAIVMVIHRENTWAHAVSIEDLLELRDRDATDPLLVWSQLRSEWPTLPIVLAGTSLRDSAVGRRFATSVGLSSNSPPSVFVPMKDDRATLAYVESTLGAIGYIDYATWNTVMRERSANPTVVAIAKEKGEPVQPGFATIQARSYPLSRPLWLYVEERRAYRLGPRLSIERLMQASTLEESGLIPVGREEQREATRLLRGF